MPPLEALSQHPADPFGAGPFRWLQSMLPRGRDAQHRVRLHALVTICMTWLPLALLTTWEGLAVSPAPREAFLFDISAYGRYLVAAPLLVFAGYVSLPDLAAVVRLFVDADVIKERDLPRFEALVASTRRLLDSPWTAACLILVAYVTTLVLSNALYPTSLSTWVAPVSNGRSRISLAGWWRALISQPIFLTLAGVWVWRILLWARFLWCVARLDLRLIASHPDGLGGLRFVIISLRGFSILAFAIGVIAASSVAESVVIDGSAPAEFRFLIGAQVLLVLLFFAGPLMLLSSRLWDLKITGTLRYGWLASELGRQFEAHWLKPGKRIESEALGAPDFSATVDLYTIAAHVRSINVLVVDLRLVIVLGISTLLPYVPIVFIVMPLDEVARLALKTVL
jgi:hypothetical protein